jgi:hypothetical protein
MRGRAALIDPGLNVLMTQSQYQDTIYHMAKTLTVNRYKASRLWIYVVFSVPVWFLVHLCKSLLYCLQSSNRTDQPSYEQTKKILDRSTEPVDKGTFAENGWAFGTGNDLSYCKFDTAMTPGKSAQHASFCNVTCAAGRYNSRPELTGYRCYNDGAGPPTFDSKPPNCDSECSLRA